MHLKEVVEWMNISSWELFKVTSQFDFPLSIARFEEYLRKMDPQNHKAFSVIDQDNREHIGHFEIKNISLRHLNGTGAHIILSPKFRGRGIGTKLVKSLNWIGFKILGLQRLGISVHTFNVPAVVTYFRAGYVFEGILKNALLFEGKRYSLYQMGLLAVNWEKNFI